LLLKLFLWAFQVDLLSLGCAIYRRKRFVRNLGDPRADPRANVPKKGSIQASYLCQHEARKCFICVKFLNPKYIVETIYANVPL